MTNLEWFNEIGMIEENEVWTETPDLKGQIGVNLVIALRDDDFKKYSEKGFDWLLAEHKEPIKLKQWEYDTIKYHGKLSKFNDIHFLMAMKNKGYFKDMNSVEKCSMTIKEILDNCEVVE